MNRNSLRSIAGLAFAAGLLLPAIASAQVSAHELSLSGKVLYQQEKNNGDLKVRSESFKIKDIAELKMVDLNANDVDAAVKILAGSARSMGIEVVG